MVSHSHIVSLLRDICVPFNILRMVVAQPLARMMLRTTQASRLITSRQMSGGHDDSIIDDIFTSLYHNLAGSWKVWKNLFFFAAVPVIIASTINAFYLADPGEMDPPPFVPYDHLRIRTKVQLTLHRRHFRVSVNKLLIIIFSL